MIGRKRVVVTSIALFGLFSLLTPLAGDMQALSWTRLFTGLGLGGALPNLIALVNESSAPNRRNANVALAYSGAPFGGAVASLISMTLQPSHWRWIFVAGGVAPLMLAPIMLAKLRESPAFARIHEDVRMAIAATAAYSPFSPPAGRHRRYCSGSASFLAC